MKLKKLPPFPQSIRRVDQKFQKIISNNRKIQRIFSKFGGGKFLEAVKEKGLKKFKYKSQKKSLKKFLDIARKKANKNNISAHYCEKKKFQKFLTHHFR